MPSNKRKTSNRLYFPKCGKCSKVNIVNSQEVNHKTYPTCEKCGEVLNLPVSERQGVLFMLHKPGTDN